MRAPAKPVHTIQVRELVEFVLRQGDLNGQGQFFDPDRARAGIRGHQKIQRSRPAGYQTEIPFEHVMEQDVFILKIRGRIDGLYATAGEVLLEEIKTVPGTWDRRADPLHWAQAKCYGHLYASHHALDQLVIQLTYLELATDRVTELRQVFSVAELACFFEATTAVYLAWLREHHQWCDRRNQSLSDLTFPFPDYRPGQRELAVAAYRVLSQGGRLFLAAPTGLGKTISVLFPAVKALGEGKLERIFYLTARTVGRGVAERALADLRRGGMKLRAVTLTAKAKVCVRLGQPCDPQTCPLALGYYDRVKPAIREALEREEINRSTLEAVGRKHQVCPFELSLDVSLWSDAVICDYNYVFDPQVYLRRHFDDTGGQYGLLVDEAHNLVDRAREMFSAELEGRELSAVRRAIHRTVPRCAKALAKLIAGLQNLGGAPANPQTPSAASDPSGELDLFPTPEASVNHAARLKPPAVQAGKSEVSTSIELPASLIPLLEAVLAEAASWLTRNLPADFREDLLTLYFRLLTFRRTAELYDVHFVTVIENAPDLKVRLFCLDPSLLLRQALARGHAAIFFSATLTPVDYYRTLLGGTLEDPVCQLSSPFPPEHLAVLIQDRIQTDFKGRAGSVGEVAAAIGTVVAGRRGNYLVYFPSYQYLRVVLLEFQARYPSVPVLVQKPGLTESERDAFLAAFSLGSETTLAGFAVLGGIFGEGIDLVGERLIGAIIVGVGLPQLGIERDLIRDYFQRQSGAGFDYAYTFPGMNRVLQAVGRVVRSATDRGVVLLIDVRFSELRYRRLFPPWWQFQRVRNPASLQTAVDTFWTNSAR